MNFELNIESLLTFILILATVYYNRKTIMEMQKERILGEKPLVIANKMVVNDPKARGGVYSCINCMLENIGKGPALNIHVAIYDSGSKLIAMSDNFIDYLTIESKTDDSHIHIKNKDLDEMTYKKDKDGDMVSNVRVVMHYDDSFNNTYYSERHFVFEKGGSKFDPLLGSYRIRSKKVSKLGKMINQISIFKTPAFLRQKN